MSKPGAIFDMDGLMFDTEHMYQEIWHQLAEERNMVLPETFAKEISGTSGELMYGFLRKYYPEDDPVLLAAECKRRIAERLKQDVPMKPGLRELLEFLKENHVRMIVASSTAEEVIRSNLRVSDTMQYFDHVISGADLSHSKPAPDIFLLAAEVIGLAPEDCYVLEDSVNGVLAGLAAGCKTIMVPDYMPPTEAILHSDAVICSSLLEVLQQMKEGQI
ncbi:MAG: HAD family phosphatase [Solobacterium sp.]|nr:HAD family phosphatase [Solobacterium sp.]